MTETRILEPDGRAIPYGEEGAGPAVILIAGRGLNITSLDTLAHSVSLEDFRVIRVGSRRPSNVAPTLHDLAQDVVDVMAHLGVEHAWVGGHAFGGAVARIVALDHHDLVNGVLLLGVAVDVGDLPEVPESFRDTDVADLQLAAWSAPEALAEGLPVLVIQGTDDVVAPTQNGERLRESAPDRVSVVNVEGGGYLFPSTHVGATSWAIEDYLDWD